MKIWNTDTQGYFKKLVESHSTSPSQVFKTNTYRVTGTGSRSDTKSRFQQTDRKETNPSPKGFKKTHGSVSKNRGGSPKWMVKIMENPIKMDDLGVKPIFGNTQSSYRTSFLPTSAETSSRVCTNTIHRLQPACCGLLSSKRSGSSKSGNCETLRGLNLYQRATNKKWDT